MVTHKQIQICVDVAKRYGVRKLVLFGSAAQNPEQANDIDLLCSGVRGWQFLSMGADMEHESGAIVDTIPFDDPSRFAEYNLSRGKVLYES